MNKLHKPKTKKKKEKEHERKERKDERKKNDPPATSEAQNASVTNHHLINQIAQCKAIQDSLGSRGVLDQYLGRGVPLMV